MLVNLRKAVWRSASHCTPKDSLLDAKTCVRPRFRRIGESRNVGRRQDAVEGGAHEACRLFIGGQNGRPTSIDSRGVRTSSHNWLLFLGVRFCLNILLVSETKYTNIVSRVE